MSPDHIVLARDISTPRSSGHLLYYYQGNFFHPLTLSGGSPGKVKRLIKQFTRENRAMVEADRAHPDYLTLLELFDMEPPG